MGRGIVSGSEPRVQPAFESAWAGKSLHTSSQQMRRFAALPGGRVG